MRTENITPQSTNGCLASASIITGGLRYVSGTYDGHPASFASCVAQTLTVLPTQRNLQQSPATISTGAPALVACPISMTLLFIEAVVKSLAIQAHLHCLQLLAVFCKRFGVCCQRGEINVSFCGLASSPGYSFSAHILNQPVRQEGGWQNFCHPPASGRLASGQLTFARRGVAKLLPPPGEQASGFRALDDWLQHEYCRHKPSSGLRCTDALLDYIKVEGPAASRGRVPPWPVPPSSVRTLT
jgi:hypothetical protein